MLTIGDFIFRRDQSLKLKSKTKRHMTAVVFQLQHRSLLLRLIAVTLDDRPNISSVSSLHEAKRCRRGGLCNGFVVSCIDCALSVTGDRNILLSHVHQHYLRY